MKHDHRHADGSEDVLTMYGGDTDAPGSAVRQEFPVDAESIALFERESSEASVTNTWAMEVEPGERFLYELSRPGARKSVVQGKSVSVSVDLGGLRNIKKKKNRNTRDIGCQ